MIDEMNNDVVVDGDEEKKDEEGTEGEEVTPNTDEEGETN